MKTRTYLLIMALVILLPAIGFSWVGLNMLLERERDAQLRGVQETARAAAVTIDREIAAAEASLKVLANSQLLKMGDFENLHGLMTRSNKTADSWTLLSDETGRPLVNTLVPYRTSLPSAGGGWIKRVLQSPGTSVSNYFYGWIAKQPAVSVDMRVEVAPGKKYVLSQVFYASHFANAFKKQNLKPSWIIGLFGSDGIAIARTDNSAQQIGYPVRPQLYEAARKNASGMIRFVASNGELVYAVYTPTELSTWTVAIGVPIDEIEKAAREATLFWILALAVTFSLAALVTVQLGRKLSRSLHQTADAAIDLQRGAVTRPIKSNVEEIDILQASLYETGTKLAEVEASRRKLEEERASLLISEQNARKAAELQNKAKDEFLAMLGHELRNPLAAISGALSILDIPTASAEQTGRAREIARRQSVHLSHIIDDLLDISRILAGKIRLKKRRTNLAELVAQCVTTQKELDKGHHEWAIDTRDAWVDADRTRMEQVITNILANAVKYTGEGGAIHVSVAIEGASAVVSVADTGIGIPTELLPTIFDVFVQGQVTLDRSRGGLGIGLSLVRQLVDMHGGSVEAASTGSGQGSTFTLRLPSTTPAQDDGIEEGDARTAREMRILVAEDNEDGRDMLATMLGLHGHRVAAAKNGVEALSLAEGSEFDVAIVDIGLPDISGYEVASRMQSNVATREIKLIALTGYGSEEDKKKAQKAGFSRHVTKPYTYEKLADLF